MAIDFKYNGNPNNTKPIFKKIFGMEVIYIDKVPTLIKSIKKGIIKGFILNDNMTTEECFVSSFNGFTAHGKTIKESSDSAMAKFFANMHIDEKIKEFKNIFKKNKKYKGQDFFNWHFILTGSCEQGRENFVKNKSIDLQKGFTPLEFLEICKNNYGSDILRRISYE
ncbi:MAG: hypothetical protein ACK5N8_06630 [Alphaproteobacteria bacterium]